MKYNDLVAFWGGLSKTAKVLGIKHKQTVYQWKGRGVPLRWQLKAAAMSGGRLKPDREARELAEDLVGYVGARRAQQ